MAENRKLRRVTDLFVTGTTVDLTGDGTELVFVRKPNAFERGEADSDGRAARQLRMATLQREDNNRASVIQQAAERLEDAELLNGAITQDKNRAYLLALDDVKSDEEWADKLEMLERTDQRIADGAELSEEEREEFGKVNLAYMTAVQAAHEKRIEQLKAEHEGDTREELVRAYVNVWVDMEGLAAFEEERWATTLYYAIRDCSAKTPKDGSVKDVNHARCTHPRLLESKREVRELPDGFRELVEPALRDLLMDQASAGNLAAPTSSSESSGPQDVEEESPASTPRAG
jgi:hypothetical protein